jgi:Arc/MetJ-type ribon-helix-helix transcriptional regulator
MVVGMATRKVTVTLEVSQVARIGVLVAEGVSGSVSGFVQHAVSTALDDLAGWDAVLGEGLASSGGELSADERAWADRVLGIGAAPGRMPAA